MAEEKDPKVEARRIAGAYLSKLGWTREWRRAIVNEIPPDWRTEDIEVKNRRADTMEEEAETEFSSEFEAMRKSSDPNSKEILREILRILGSRSDLGFIGKRIIARLKEMFHG